MTKVMHSDDVRTFFSRAMSDMYRKEVPQYGALLDLVQDVNNATLAANPALKDRLKASGELERLDVERHGAIRLGTAEELFNIRRLFAVMGMFPVGYYDLSIAGLPVHSTAFRPITSAALSRNPFRVFTSLLRLELIEDRALAKQAEAILAKRQIITERALALIDIAEKNAGLTEQETTEFVSEALETFRWHSEATVSAQTYDKLNQSHGLIADVVSFQGPHINHLTPRTLDIGEVHKQMPKRGMSAKATVEGPPSRQASILLRQTSFKALEEKVLFTDEAKSVEGAHTARFGEVEQRGIALTEKGRKLYDQTLATVRANTQGKTTEAYAQELAGQFAEFPDDYETLHKQSLAFFRYRIGKAEGAASENIDDLIQSGALICEPQTYEDFLPVSAAGIFQSNLGTNAQSNYSQAANQSAFEEALGVPVTDELALYQQTQDESLSAAIKGLKI